MKLPDSQDSGLNPMLELLRRGASLSEIGEVLRHRHASTTQIYAKVDLSALRALVQPWLGGVR